MGVVRTAVRVRPGVVRRYCIVRSSTHNRANAASLCVQRRKARRLRCSRETRMRSRRQAMQVPRVLQTSHSTC